MKESPHILRLFLDSPLDVALTKYQAIQTLGRSYAGLLVFIEGLRKLELINEVVYQHYKAKYMQPLRTLPEEEVQKNATQILLTEKEQQNLRKKFRHMLELTPLSAKQREQWLKEASDHPEIPESKELLKKLSGAYGHE